jgi:hypothetical protein
LSPTHLPYMGAVRKIGFAEALDCLQGLLGEEVSVMINFRGTFGGVTQKGCLSRVETIPPDHTAINLLLDERQELVVDPIDTEALLSEEDGDVVTLELHPSPGVVVLIEPCSSVTATTI